MTALVGPGQAQAKGPAAEGLADSLPPASVIESPYAITRDKVELLGTLALPAGPAGKRIPVALIVAGSGPTDRNGNSPIAGIRPFTYAQLAWGLAQRGIASVRFDKRGLGPSAVGMDPTTLSVEDYYCDVIAGAEALKRDSRFSRVILIGHSEGAMLVLLAANAGAPAAGVIMMSGQERRMEVVLREQLARQVDSTTLAAFDAGFGKYLRGEETGPLPPVLQSILVPQYRRLIQGLAAYDPAAEIARASVPVMIVQGGMDIQITEDDAQQLKAARPAAELVVIPAANHAYKPVTERNINAQLASYQDFRLPIVPELVPSIAAWIAGIR